MTCRHIIAPKVRRLPSGLSVLPLCKRFKYVLYYERLTGMLVSDVLYRAKQLLEIGWIKGHLAVDANGRDVDPWSEKAVAWCEVGAIMAVIHHLENADAAERMCLSMINMASPNLLKYDTRMPMMVENDRTDQERAVEMATRAYEFALKHPVEIEIAR